VLRDDAHARTLQLRLNELKAERPHIVVASIHVMNSVLEHPSENVSCPIFLLSEIYEISNRCTNSLITEASCLIPDTRELVNDHAATPDISFFLDLR
jgi:hypothetical protein